MSKNIHSLHEFGFAKQVVSDIPKIIVELEKTHNSLSLYNHYRDVADVLYAINDARTMLDIQFQVYKEIYEKKAQS